MTLVYSSAQTRFAQIDQMPPDELESFLVAVEKLGEEEKHVLTQQLVETHTQRPLTIREKRFALHLAVIRIPILEEPPIRREDWYGDDGR